MEFNGVMLPISLELGKACEKANKQDEEDVSMAYRAGAGICLVAAAIEAVVSGVLMVVTSLLKNCNDSTKEWHAHCERWSNNATRGCENFWQIACGKTNGLNKPVPTTIAGRVVEKVKVGAKSARDALDKLTDGA